MHYFFDIFKILKDVHFANPYYFLLLLLIIPMVGWQLWKRRKMQPALHLPTLQPLTRAPRTWKQRLQHLPLIVLMLAYALFVVAMARPQSGFRQQKVNVEVVDIVLALDVSSSMKAMDFQPNRLSACKKVAKEFIEGRLTDRIGLVVYAGEAYTQCPLTTDHQTLLGMIDKVKFDLVEDGTAIGDGLGTAINRLRESNAKSKIIILLTDGVNNQGYIDPHSAAEMANDYDIKVYTIGCGTNGTALFPTPYGNVPMKSEIDENLLRNIADATGGQYFRATNGEKLKQVYAEIDKMEKTLINETIFEHKADEFLPFVMLGVFFFAIFILLNYWLLRKNP
jgi:Ca-activated chloride channel family protein